MENLKIDDIKEDEYLLKVVYIPEHKVQSYNMTFLPHVTIVGNKKGLKYLIDKISDYLESGDCEYDNLNFDIGRDLSEGSIDMDVVYEDFNETKYLDEGDKITKKETDDFLLKIEYLPMYRDELLDAMIDPHITIIGNKKGLRYLIDKISDYLESGDCEYDNLNFDIGHDLSEGPIDMDVVYEDLMRRNKV